MINIVRKHIKLNTNCIKYRYYNSTIIKYNIEKIKNNNEIDYSYHIPVMRDEICDHLSIKEDGIYVDCTLGININFFICISLIIAIIIFRSCFLIFYDHFQY